MGSSGAEARAATRRQARGKRNKRETFLAQFAANCNVGAAAMSAGVAVSTIYRWRMNDADFAAQWGEALAMGYQLLEARLVAHALTGERGETLDGLAETPVEPVNVELALKLLDAHRRGAHKPPVGRPRAIAAPEDTLNTLLRRLELIEKRKRAEQAAQAIEAPAPLAIEHDPQARPA